VGQITQLERREAALQKISRHKKEAAHIPPIEAIPEDAEPVEPASKKRKRKNGKPRQKTLPTLDFAESESLPYTPPEFHYHISQSRNYHFNITQWLGENQGDPAIKVRNCLESLLPAFSDVGGNRISVRNFKSIYLGDFCIPPGRAMATSSPRRNVISF
jgi:hypothetical protein